MHHIAFHYLPHPSCVVVISVTVGVTMANDMLLEAFGLAMINAKVRLLCELLHARTQNRSHIKTLDARHDFCRSENGVLSRLW